MGAAGVANLDLFWMRRALAEARKGRGAVEPNPMVGAVVVREGPDVLTLGSLLVLALFGFGIVGALRHPPGG